MSNVQEIHSPETAHNPKLDDYDLVLPAVAVTRRLGRLGLNPLVPNRRPALNPIGSEI
jgi:hypothetical protein